jgi:hypothetical protein
MCLQRQLAVRGWLGPSEQRNHTRQRRTLRTAERTVVDELVMVMVVLMMVLSLLRRELDWEPEYSE